MPLDSKVPNCLEKHWQTLKCKPHKMTDATQLDLLWQLSEKYFKLKCPLGNSNQYKFLPLKNIVIANFGRYIIAIKLKNILKGKTIYKFLVKADSKSSDNVFRAIEAQEFRFRNTAFLKSLLKGLDYNKKISKVKQKSNINVLQDLIQAFKSRKHVIDDAYFHALLRQENISRGRCLFEKIKVIENEDGCAILAKMNTSSLSVIWYSYRLRKIDQLFLDKRLAEIAKTDKLTVCDFSIVNLEPQTSTLQFALLTQSIVDSSFAFYVIDHQLSTDKLSVVQNHSFEGKLPYLRILKKLGNSFMLYHSSKLLFLTFNRKEPPAKNGKARSGANASPNSQSRKGMTASIEETDLHELFSKEGLYFSKPLRSFKLSGSICFVYPQYVVDYKLDDKKIKVLFRLTENGLLLIIFSHNSKIYEKKMDIHIYKNPTALFSKTSPLKNVFEGMFFYMKECKVVDLLDAGNGAPSERGTNRRDSKRKSDILLAGFENANQIEKSRFLYNVAHYQSNKFVSAQQKLVLLKAMCPNDSPLGFLLNSKTVDCSHPTCKQSVSNLDIKAFSAKCSAGHFNIYLADLGEARAVWDSKMRFCEVCSAYFSGGDRCGLCCSALL